MQRLFLFLLSFSFCLTTTRLLTLAVAQEQASAQVVFDMDTVRHHPTTGSDKQPIGTVEIVPGKVGQACQFTFPKEARGGFFAASVQATPDWDNADGISFWVKGDGSTHWGGLELIDRTDYKLRYGYCFPLAGTEWHKVIVPWCDLIPELPAGKPVDTQHGYAPSGFGNLWFGKWYYWNDYPACRYAIDQISLEPQIPVDRPDEVVPGTSRLLEKLRAGKAVTVVTMGDSLSDKRHWANREVLWSELLAEKLQKRFGSEVTLVNPAIGGTQLTQNLVLMPRWLRDHPHPDLVTVWFGFNDWDGGMPRRPIPNDAGSRRRSNSPHDGRAERHTVDDNLSVGRSVEYDGRVSRGGASRRARQTDVTG